jgi:hypothetical protein
MAEGIGCDVAYGLGTPYSFSSKHENHKGELNFKIEQMRDYELNQEELIKYIQEAL